jgi:micrococcal nuclease
MSAPPLRPPQGIHRYLRIGCIGAVIVFGVLAIISSLFSRENPTPTEKAEGRKGVEQVEKQQAKQPKQEIENEDEDQARYDAVATVSEVVDGDTVEIEPAVDGEDEVRIIGVDTPETKDPDEGEEPYGKEASNYTSTELEGEKVELEFDEDKKDQDGRLLAYVYPKGEDLFNGDLLEEGYAQVYTVEPNSKYEDRYESAQDEAREEDLGIWGLSKQEQCQLANHGNGIGEGSPGCAAESGPAPSGDVDCSLVDGPIPVSPGDPNNLDADGDGLACEGSGTASASATATASPSLAPNPSPNRDDVPSPNAPNPNAPGNATSSPSPAAGTMSAEECISEGGTPVAPGTDGDGDGDGCAGES